MNKIKFFACFTLVAAILSVGACSQQSQVASDTRPVKNTQVIREDVTPHDIVAGGRIEEPVTAPQSYTIEDVYNLAVNSPYCELEDGSDLPQCYWHDGAGDGSEPPYTDIVYMPDGYGYQAHEDTMTVSVFVRNPWL